MEYTSLEDINSSEINHFNLAAWCVIKIFNLKSICSCILVNCTLFFPLYEIIHIVNTLYK